MINKNYNKLINTGVKWLPEINSKWKIGRVKDLFYISKELSTKNNPIILSLARSAVKVRDISNNEGQLAASYDNYNSVQVGDLLLNPMDLYSGANCNVSYVDGVISPAYSNLRAKIQLEPKYYDYYFKTQYWTMAMFTHGKGVSFDNRWTLNNDALLNYEVPIVPFNEQQKIVDILNKKVSQIDALILNQENQIEKLKEYKQSLITKIVTKGLNKNVEMKDSGVDSIGLVPAHWQVSRAKYIFNDLLKGAGISKEEVFSNGNIQCVRYGEIYTKYDISFKQTFSKTIEDKITTKVYLNYGDIIFSATGELVEEIGKNVVYLGNDKCLAGGDIIIGRHSQNPKFLNYTMYCSASQMQKSKGKAKLKVVHISATNIGNIIVAIPNISEQNEIASYLDEKCSKIDKLIEIKHSKIEKLQEYKKSIIYEYVTGKKLVD